MFARIAAPGVRLCMRPVHRGRARPALTFALRSVYAVLRRCHPERARTIGIDYGVTSACVCVMEEAEVRVIENLEGERTTPAVVALPEDGHKHVGNTAKRNVRAEHSRIHAFTSH